MNPDPITIEILRNAFIMAAEEMNAALIRSAYTPVIYESKDCAVALVDSRHRVLGQSSGVPLFLGNLEACTLATEEMFGRSVWEEGDIWIMNDAYLTGTHMHDVTVLAPIFYRGDLAGFAASRAHWLDIGAKDPGVPMDSTEIFQEGVRLPPTKVVRDGKPVGDIWSIIESNVRFPRSAIGDMKAQFAVATIVLLAALMWLLNLLASLTASVTGSSSAVDIANNTITIRLSEEPPQLDSTLLTDQVSGVVIGHVMEGLLRYDQNQRLAPGMAERWEIDEQQATFYLRDALWSDGKPVTAHDFVFAWRTVLDPINASEYAFILYPIRNAEAINNDELPTNALGARALDDKTLVVELERPIAFFDKLTAFSTYLPVRQDFYEATDGRYGADADQLLYNGPFIMESWVHGQSLFLRKNPHYWDAERIRLDAINVGYIVSDANAVLNLFKDEKIALASLTAENLPEALAQRWQIDRFMDGSVFFIEFNHKPDRLTRNRNLRKAMQLAQNPNELVYKVIKLPGYLPGESLFPTFLKGVQGSFRDEYTAPTHRMDLAQARRHLEQAKLELGLDEFPSLVLLTGDNPVSNIQSEYFQALFKKNLGLDIKIDRQIFKQRLAKMTDGDFDMVLAGWGPDYDDALTFGDLLASWNENNRGRYANPEYDRLVRVAQDSMDARVRMDAFAEMQRIIHEDAVLILNYERGQVYVTHPQVKGIVRRVVGCRGRSVRSARFVRR